MMSDVQVSNARRIIFTVLALVALWVLAWTAFWLGCDRYDHHGFFTAETAGRPVVIVGVALSLALLPTLLLYLSPHDRLVRRPEPWIWLAGLGFMCTSGFCYWLGIHSPEIAGVPLRYRAYVSYDAGVSWVWLLLPIILTTAFVIVGAWRRAVRDAEVAAVGEEV